MRIIEETWLCDVVGCNTVIQGTPKALEINVDNILFCVDAHLCVQCYNKIRKSIINDVWTHDK